jgi:hypothetical protein
MEADSADPAAASDEVIDLIATIELHRQAMEKESNAAAARGEVLRRLHELLAGERAALQSHGPGARHAANIARVTLEIAKLGKPADDATRPADSGKPRAAHPLSSQAQHNLPRHKGRRTMGRGER